MTRIDRRALFASGAAAALLAATGVSLAQTPQPGGRLRLAVPRDSGSLEAVVRGAVFDTLTEVAPDGIVRGELAEGWRGDAQARIWQFELRAGVRFHDGAQFGAEDAARSLAAHDAAFLDGARIEAVGPLALRIELARGNPDLPLHLADPALVIARQGAVGLRGEEVNGTGLYRAVRLREGRHFLGRKVADNYRRERAGWVDEVEVVVIPDPAVRAEALRDGFVDVAAWPAREGVQGRGDFVFHPSGERIELAARAEVGVPRRIGGRRPLDDGRIAERWWMAGS